MRYSANMYTPSSPVLSSLSDYHNSYLQQSKSKQCLRFKFFITFFISTICLILLSASLATHKWIVAKPIRILRLNNSQTNITSLMLSAQQDEQAAGKTFSSLQSLPLLNIIQSPQNPYNGSPLQAYTSSPSPQGTKFQGEIYFGLFKGVKILNYGFGDRVSHISVIQSQFPPTNGTPTAHQELINFKLWLLTVFSVALATLFALIGSIFAIINFVMTPRRTLTGPVGLVIWNATACFSALLALVSWLIEYFVRLQVNVLTMEEMQNGWTSDHRSQFGYSYYLVLLAFVLHLVNIFIISIVQFESLSGSSSSKSSSKRQSRPSCEGVIMLY